MTFSRWVFRVAGIYGLLVLPPLYFLEAWIGADDPPPITHPEYYYGFVGVGVAWQIAFLVISLDPVRYRLMMLPSIVEKLTFGIAALVLFAAGRINGMLFAASLGDLIAAALFAIAFWLTYGSNQPE